MAKLAVVLAIPLALLATVASLGVVVVDVREGGPDGHRIILPVPLVVVQAALAAVPADKARLPMEHAAEHLPLARELIEALAEAPDGELVRVEEPDEEVRVTKVGDALRVRVRVRGEEVSANVPLRLVLSALPDDGGRLSTLALAGALSSVRFTDLVEVRDGDDHVKVWVW